MFILWTSFIGGWEVPSSCFMDEDAGVYYQKETPVHVIANA
jgi:hypothetical protein